MQPVKVYIHKKLANAKNAKQLANTRMTLFCTVLTNMALASDCCGVRVFVGMYRWCWLDRLVCDDFTAIKKYDEMVYS